MIGVYISLGVALVLLVVMIVMGGGTSRAVREEILRRLSELQPLSRGSASERKDAIVQMDTLLGKGLAYAGVKGETIGERLKNARSFFDKNQYNMLWEAHKLRNVLVHEHKEVSAQEAERAVSTFNSAIRRLVK